MLSTEHITSMPVVVMGIKNHAQNDVFAQNYSFGVVLTPNSPMCNTYDVLSYPGTSCQPTRVGGSLLYFLGQFVILFVSARISDVSAMYQRCISVSALSRS